MFTFDSIDTAAWSREKADAADLALARQMNVCWVAFAKMPAGTRSVHCANGFDWKPYAKAGETALFETNGPKMADGRSLPDGPPNDQPGA